MTPLQLNAQIRAEKGRANAALRRKGMIPAVVYGNGVTTRSLCVDVHAFENVLKAAGESTLIDLGVDHDAPVKVIIQDIQRDAATGVIAHIDFHQVSMKEKLTVDVALHFTGESPAVKELGGTLVKDRDAVEVECLPTDLVKEIAVDISQLKDFEQIIRASDIILPKGLALVSSADDALVHVEAPRTEAELAELDTAVEEDVTKVEKVEKPQEEPDETVPAKES